MDKWWGYVHVNGSLIVKRYFGAQDIQEAKESDFVGPVFGPFEAEGRQAAVDTIKAIIGVYYNHGNT